VDKLESLATNQQAFTLDCQGDASIEGRTMMRKAKALPSRFPVGTKFVIEGRPAGDGEVQIFKRYIEFPDGRYLQLPARTEKPRSAALRRTRRPAGDPAHR
jgi:hypothetical protein